jgi:HEAT repeat protein
MSEITPEAVKQLLESADYGDRLRGVNQLRSLEPKRAFEMIQGVVTDSNVRVRYAAVSQLATLGHQNSQRSLEILRDRLINDKEMDVQAAAADALGALKLTEAFEDLQMLFQTTPEWLVRMSIVAALGELGDPRVFELLKEALASENELVQTAAVGALGELGDIRAVPLLIPYASNPDWQIRYRVVQALGHLGGAEASQMLTHLSNDPVDQVSQAARACLS